MTNNDVLRGRNPSHRDTTIWSGQSLLVVLAAVAALALAGCSGPGAEQVQPAEQAPSSTSSVPIVKPPITIGATSSTTATTELLADEELLVREVHGRFMTELFARDERVAGPAAWLPLARELTGGAQLARIEDSTRRRTASGDRGVSDGYESNVISVEVRGDVARVMDCSRDRGALLDAGGIEVLSADEDFLLRQTRLERTVDGQWKVTEFFTGGGVGCDPANA